LEDPGGAPPALRPGLGWHSWGQGRGDERTGLMPGGRRLRGGLQAPGTPAGCDRASRLPRKGA
jgi:hypothetical protein